VPEIVRAGGHTVGLRCPDHPLTLALLKAAGVPFAAPSANPSGAPSPKNAGQVLEYFDGKIDAVSTAANAVSAGSPP
jgi:L-threonylcarbamoyladenylate synthase